MSDFPEFDAAYQTILIKDLEDRFEQLAAQANFNVYHSDIWRGTARKFAESIVKECVGIVEGGHFLHEDAPDAKFARECSSAIKRHFGVDE